MTSPPARPLRQPWPARFGDAFQFVHSLRWNLVVTFLVVAVLPVLVGAVIGIRTVRTLTREQVTLQLESVSELKRNKINRWVMNSQEAIRLLLAEPSQERRMLSLLAASADRSPGADLADPSGDAQQVSAYLVRAAQAQQSFHEFFLYDTSGRVVAASNQKDVGKILNRRPYFAASLRGEFVQPPYYEVGIEGITLLTGRPLRDPDGQVVGVLAGRLDATTLGQIMLERTGLGETGETYLVSAESHYMVTPSLWESSEYPLTRAYFSEGIDRALQGEGGHGVYGNFREPPVTVIGAYRWLPDLQVALVAEIDEQEALDSLQETERFVTFLAISAAAIAALVGLIIADRITGPVTALAHVASRFSHGQLHERAQPPRLIEVRTVAEAFNGMADRAQKLVTSLEGRVTELHEAQEALRTSEERYALVEQAVSDGVWDWNILTGEDYLSPRWKEILGYAADDLPNHEASFFTLIHPDDQPRVREAIERHFAEGLPYRVEIRLQHKDGAYRWVLARGEALRDASGRPVRMVGSITDVTDRRNADRLLRESEARLSLVFNSTSDLQVLLRVESGDAFRVEAMNSAYLAYLHRCAPNVPLEMVGRDRVEVLEEMGFPAGMVEPESAILRRVVASGEAVRSEIAIDTADGSLALEVTAQPVLDSEGACTHLIWTGRDISERMAAMKELAASERRLRDLIDAFPGNVGLYTADGTSLSVNRQALESDVRRRTQPPGVKIWDLPHWREAGLSERMRDTVARVQRGEIVRFDATLPMADGTTMDVDASFAPLFDAAGKVEFIATFGIVVTERNRAVAALRESERRYRALFESIGDAVIVYDARGRFIDCNEATSRMLGYSRDEFLKLQPEDLVHDNARAEYESSLETVRERLAGGESVLVETVQRHKDGRPIPVELHTRQLAYQGEPFVLAVVRDISERHAAERELRERDLRLRRAESLARMGHYAVDPRYQNPVWSDGIKEIWGYDPETEPSVADFLARIHPDDYDPFMAEVETARREGRTYDYEYRIIRQDGTTATVHSIGESSIDAADESAIFFGMSIDITERTEMERQLRTERNFTAAVLDNAGALVLVLDRKGRIRRFNRAAEQLSGYSFDEVEGRCPWDVVLPPEDVDTIRIQAFDALVNHPESLTGRYTNDWVTRTGERRTLEWVNTLLRDERDEVQYMVTVGIDVTDRLRVERRLQEQDHHNRTLLQLANRLEQARTYEDVAQGVRDAIASSVGYRNVWMMLSEDGGLTYDLVTVEAEASSISETLATRPSIRHQDMSADPFLREIAETNHIVVVEDMRTDPRTDKEKVTAMGSRTSVHVPIRLADRRVGVIGTGTFGEEGVRAPTESELILLRAMANQVALTTDRIAFTEALSRAERVLRESQERLEEAQRIARLGSWELDLVSNQLSWSDEIYRLFECDRTHFTPSYETFLAAIHPDDRDAVNDAYTQSIQHRAPYQITHRLQMADGRIKWVDERCETEYAPDGTAQLSRGTVQDVTEIVRIEQELRDSLREKETLLREVHHRVKNNLQIISSLLYFQEKKVHNPGDASVFIDSRNRLRSMILVHEKLYRSSNLLKVELLDYLRVLCNDVRANMPVRVGSIGVRAEGEPVDAPIEIALPGGMIVCELVTNAFKHAFPDQRPGNVVVEIHQVDGKVVVTVSDDGVGFPPGFDPSRVDSFGWQLIRGLTAQLDGVVEIASQNGSQVTVTFPVEARH